MNINIKAIFKKYSNLYQFEEGAPEYFLDKEDFKNAIKEIVETVIDKCAEEVKLYTQETLCYKNGKHCKPYLEIGETNLLVYNGTEGYNDDPVVVLPDKQSILAVKQMIDYEG